MAAEKAIRALLMQSSAITALVADRCYPLILPQGCALPGLVVEDLNTSPIHTIGAAFGGAIFQSHIQVSVLASGYTQKQDLIAAAIQACNYQRGLIAGLQISSVLHTMTGPDAYDDERIIYQQTLEFQIIYQ